MSHVRYYRYVICVWGTNPQWFSSFKMSKDCVKHGALFLPLTGKFTLQNQMEFFTGTNPNANLQFLGIFDSNGLGPIAAWVVGKSMQQGNKWERRKDLISYSRMMICMCFVGIQSTWLVCVPVCVKCSIYISFDIYIWACLLKTYAGAYSHLFHKCMNLLAKIFQHYQGCKHLQLQKALPTRDGGRCCRGVPRPGPRLAQGAVVYVGPPPTEHVQHIAPGKTWGMTCSGVNFNWQGRATCQHLDIFAHSASKTFCLCQRFRHTEFSKNLQQQLLSPD